MTLTNKQTSALLRCGGMILFGAVLAALGVEMKALRVIGFPIVLMGLFYLAWSLMDSERLASLQALADELDEGELVGGDIDGQQVGHADFSQARVTGFSHGVPVELGFHERVLTGRHSRVQYLPEFKVLVKGFKGEFVIKRLGFVGAKLNDGVRRSGSETFKVEAHPRVRALFDEAPALDAEVAQVFLHCRGQEIRCAGGILSVIGENERLLAGQLIETVGGLVDMALTLEEL